MNPSLFWVRLATANLPARPLCWVNLFWLTLFPSPDTIPNALTEFLQFNLRSTSATVWDSLKAFLRGCTIGEITGIKRMSREWEASVPTELQHTEQALVNNPTWTTHSDWAEVIMSAAEKKVFPSTGLF